VALFAQFAAVAKSLAHAHRLELLEQLAQGERRSRSWRSEPVPTRRSTCSRCGGPGSSPPAAKAKFVFCTLADEAVLDLMSALRRIAEQNIAEVERVIRSYFNDRDSLQPVSPEIVIRSQSVGGTFSGRGYLLTDPRQFGILQSGPGWRRPNAIRSTETTGLHYAAGSAAAWPLAAYAQQPAMFAFLNGKSTISRWPSHRPRPESGISLPISLSRRMLRLFGWENSDAQDQLVCGYRNFDCGRCRSMGGLDHDHSACRSSFDRAGG
jgi:hypothetical protein